ncbi:MAG: cobalamin B12-binding domain-containing protein [Actinomycetes bacterium]
MGALRIVVGKPGLDGHDRGAKVVSRALSEAGMDVYFTGLHQSAADIVQAAISHNADAIGLSILSGAHLTQFPAVIELLAERDLADIVVFGGGTIPTDDIPQLLKKGVAHIFPSGATVSEVVEWVRDNIRPRADIG